MARYTGSRCRICRREGVSLCSRGEKCALVRRAYPPGQHGQSRTRKKTSDYGLQLREKQKVKRMYGLLERQFRKTFAEADRAKGMTGEKLLEFLERRLDNVIYRSGFAVSRQQARQIVNHGHVKVNDRVVNIPSFRVRPGEEIQFVGSEKLNKMAKENLDLAEDREVPPWLERSAGELKTKIVSTPSRDDVQFPIQERLIVELYSK